MPKNFPGYHEDDFTHSDEDFTHIPKIPSDLLKDPVEIEPTPEKLPAKKERYFTIQGVLFFVMVLAGLLILGQFILPLFPEEYVEVLIYAYLYFFMGFDPTKWFGKLFGKKK